MICEQLIILGCVILISVYLTGLIGILMSLNVYFSDIYSSTIIVALSIIIAFFVFQMYATDLELYKELFINQEIKSKKRIKKKKFVQSVVLSVIVLILHIILYISFVLSVIIKHGNQNIKCVMG